MAWTAITVGDLEEVISGPELEAYRKAAGAADGSDDDKIGGVIAKITDQCRAFVEDCAENRVGAPGTLPERVHRNACLLMREAILNRIPGARISEGRQREHDRAHAFFRDVAACKLKIEQPDDGDVVSEANTPQVEVVNSQEPQAKRNQLGGLF